jgi:hypothetical protein
VRRRQEQQQQQQQVPVEGSVVLVERAVVRQPIIAVECVKVSSDLIDTSIDDSSTGRKQSAAVSNAPPSNFRFPRVFRKKNRESKRDLISPPPLTSPESKIPDNPMDVNPKEEVAMRNVMPKAAARQRPTRGFQESRPGGSRRNVMKLMRGLSTRGQFLLDRVKEIFPHADEDRVVTLQKQGVSVRTIIGVFAEESAKTASTQDTSNSHHKKEEDESGRAGSSIHLRSQQEESTRVMQIMEVFPDAPRSKIKEQLEHNSVEHIIHDLVDQSLRP